jgi:glycosyltransferase involved in cell wall biosynthesis
VLSSGSAFAYSAVATIKQNHPDMTTVDILHNDLPSGHMRSALGATRYINYHVAVSDCVARSLATHGVPTDRIVTIRNGVDTQTLFNPENYDRAAARERLGLRLGDFVVAWVGRLDVEKRPDAFLRLVADLNKHVPARAIMVGDGPLTAAVGKEVGRLRVDQAVTRVSHLARERMPEIYAAADALVMTSLIEGLPFVALEAIAMGCPVATTKVGELQSLIVEGVNGWLAPPDKPEALLGALLTLHGDETTRQQMRITARQSITNTDLNLSAMRDAYGRMFRNFSE